MLQRRRRLTSLRTSLPFSKPSVPRRTETRSWSRRARINENINFLGKAITVASTGGPSVTTIDGGGTESVVTFSSGEANSSVLEGFTITNGNASVYNLYTGGGIAIFYASPTIKNNVITNNAACSGGGIGLYVSPNAVIKYNLVTQNSGWTCAGATGGGIYIDGGGVAQIIGNTISKNTSGSGGGMFLDDAGAPTIRDNVITGNTVELIHRAAASPRSTKPKEQLSKTSLLQT